MDTSLLFRKEYLIVAFMFAILLIIIVPLSSIALDFFLIVSLSSAILVLLLSLFVQRPTDLSTFPTLLLILVLFRLALNIATTRSILSDGPLGVEAVSSIISAFGKFVVGGNMIIGVIIFIILVLINFIVVTKGAGRVAEVRARFSLDALPGKQMAIDADLNAGHIDDKQAKEMRNNLNKELSFYGTMDGSAKFVKGDAIAGIIITLVNLIGGLLIGIFQYDMSASESTEIFTILTIGDGLVSQIPSLITSTAAAIIITRSNSENDNFASGAISELGDSSQALFITGLALILFGIVPGFPTGILLTMGTLFALAGYTVYAIETKQNNALTRFFQTKEEVVDKTTMSHDEIREHRKEANSQNEQENLDKALKIDVCELKLGSLLLPLTLSNTSELVDKIKNLRVKIAKELGFVIPQIKITDDNRLESNEYSFCIKRVVIAKASIEPNKFLAMGDIKNKPISGIKTKDPVFGIDSVWIDKHQKNEALGKGLSVIDNASIISTHIAELIRKNSTDILTRDDIDKIMKKLKKEFPVLVEDMLKIDIGTILGVCKELLRENVPIVDMLSILESILDSYTLAGSSQVAPPIPELTKSVRLRLYRLITKTFTNKDGKLHVLTLNRNLTTDFKTKLQGSVLGQQQLIVSVGIMRSFIENIQTQLAILQKNDIISTILYTDANLRAPISTMLAKANVDIHVIAEGELDDSVDYVLHATIDAEDSPNADNTNT
jgi:flagellar biosynthesis protein FlhA